MKTLPNNKEKVCHSCGATVEPFTAQYDGTTYSWVPFYCEDCRERMIGRLEYSEVLELCKDLNIPKIYWEATWSDWNSPIDEAALQTAMRYVESWPHSRGLIFYGGVGNGKSLLAANILRSIGKGLWVNAAELLEDIRKSFEGPRSYLFDQARRAELLVLDDLGAEKSSDWTEERFYLLINKRWEEQLPIILTTNLNAKSLEQRLGKRTFDRLIGMTEKAVRMRGDSYRRNHAGTRDKEADH